MAKGKFSSPGLRGQNEKEFLTGKFRVPRPTRKSRFNLLQQNTKIILDEIPEYIVDVENKQRMFWL
jgi:hypothetical protein